MITNTLIGVLLILGLGLAFGAFTFPILAMCEWKDLESHERKFALLGSALSILYLGWLIGLTIH